MIIVIYVCVLVIAVWTLLSLLYPPKHCQYMVKVTNKSGVYSCSQYPRPIKVKK